VLSHPLFAQEVNPTDYLTAGVTQLRPERPSETRRSAPGPESSKVAIFVPALVPPTVWPATVVAVLMTYSSL